MELKELIEKSLEFIEHKTSYEEREEVFFISIEMYENKKEILRIYKDEIETDISNGEIIVIDSSVNLKNKEIIEEIYEYNKDTFFSKIYFDNEDELVIIENCLLYENITPKLLALVINEISNISYNIKLDLSEMEA